MPPLRVTPSSLCLNGLRYPDYIEAGSRLEVPGPRVNAGPGRHRVQPGDTLDDAARYRVSSRDLMSGSLRANHLKLDKPCYPATP